ncbi:MAG: response regulator transcription factor [Candidatus Accumulibacter sp.]|jgi:two-component system KDP operon response regulator KdpE|nr:response regulator transcription factor [Accumulibacter sp.]
MSNKDRILIVDDENGICRFMTTILESQGYEAIVARTGAETHAAIVSRCPDLVLLDLGLPDIDGIDIIKSVREWSRIPIIVVSARMHEKDKVEALDAGADDYITKPFGPSELSARIRTALRHARQADAGDAARADKRQIGDLTIDCERHHVSVSGVNAGLTKNEYRIMVLLSRHAGKVITHDCLLREIWGPYAVGNNQLLRVNMANIRRKIEKNPAEPEYIFTEPGVGYRLREEDSG